MIYPPKEFYYVVTLLLCTTILSCTQPSEQAQETTAPVENEETAETNEEVAEESAPLECILVSHKVADYANWRASFDANKELRSQYNIRDLHVFQDRNDPNDLIVLTAYHDHHDAQAFMASKEMKQAMRKAGVSSEPEVRWLSGIRQVGEEHGSNRSDKCIMVTHKVEDYDLWKAAFDAGETRRSESGLEVVQIFRSHEDENQLTLIIAVEDFETAEEFASGLELKAMESAGVISQPETMYLHIAKADSEAS